MTPDRVWTRSYPRILQHVRPTPHSYSEAASESISGNAMVILESDDELEHGVKVQVRVVADGEGQVVSQTNVEIM